ncbi:hypothetical protein HK102_002549, partial [Quaeritorhiza haematococci]
MRRFAQYLLLAALVIIYLSFTRASPSPSTESQSNAVDQTSSDEPTTTIDIVRGPKSYSILDVYPWIHEKPYRGTVRLSYLRNSPSTYLSGEIV